MRLFKPSNAEEGRVLCSSQRRRSRCDHPPQRWHEHHEHGVRHCAGNNEEESQCAIRVHGHQQEHGGGHAGEPLEFGRFGCSHRRWSDDVRRREVGEAPKAAQIGDDPYLTLLGCGAGEDVVGADERSKSCEADTIHPQRTPAT